MQGAMADLLYVLGAFHLQRLTLLALGIGCQQLCIPADATFHLRAFLSGNDELAEQPAAYGTTATSFNTRTTAWQHNESVTGHLSAYA